MAYSQFLQEKAYQFHEFHLDLSDAQNKMYICYLVIKSLELWIRQDGHEQILYSIGIFTSDLHKVAQEVFLMSKQQELYSLWQSGIIKSTNILNYCNQAHSNAFAAGQTFNNDDYDTASGHISKCQEYLLRILDISDFFGR